MEYLVEKVIKMQKESDEHYLRHEQKMLVAGGRTRYSGTMYIHGAAAVESIAMDGQSIGSKVAAAVTRTW